MCSAELPVTMMFNVQQCSQATTEGLDYRWRKETSNAAVEMCGGFLRVICKGISPRPHWFLYEILAKYIKSNY